MGKRSCVILCPFAATQSFSSLTLDAVVVQA